MNYKTTISLNAYLQKISHKDHILLLGSCFSENIGKKLSKSKFKAKYNTIGIQYNPITLSKLISQSLGNTTIQEEDIIRSGNMFYHFDFHSKIFGPTAQELINNLEKIQSTLKSQIEKSNFLFITLGSSIVHSLKVNSMVVGNCHKLPATDFEKSTLSVATVKNALENIIKNVRSANPTMQIIFSVSPIRHTKEGLVENSISKARLLAAISELTNEENGIGYFPSYEIMIDDLRDYRYYKSDLIHPSKIAIDYIWQIFSNSYFDENTNTLLKKIRRIRASLNHKAFHPNSSDHQKFLKELLSRMRAIELSYPEIKFEKEIKKIEKKLL